MTFRSFEKALGQGRWWKVRTVVVGLRPNVAIGYEVEAGNAIPPWTKDAKGRLAVEAFSALPFAAFKVRLEDRLRGDPNPSQEDLRADLRELLEFVDTFGPVGVGWGAEFSVEVEGIPGGQRSVTPDAVTGWKADFGNAGPGRFGVGRVGRFESSPAAPLAARLAAGDGWYDTLAELRDEQSDLLAVADLLGSLERRAPAAAVREAARLAVHAQTESEFDPTIDRVIDWDRVRDPRDLKRGPFRPFDPASKSNAYELGALVLASQIDRQLNWLGTRTDHIDGRFVRTWDYGSLLEIMYQQLQAQMVGRAGFGSGRCDTCGGILLRTRKDASRANRWHWPGCGNTGRQRRHRARLTPRPTPTPTD